MSYLTPGLFVVMTLGMIPMVGSEPTITLSLVPFSNFAQTLREVLSGDVHPLRYALTIASNLVYSAIAVAFAVRSFTNEKILFRS
jgi:hypothetical protein